MSEIDYDIVVVGAGAVGLAFVAAVKDSGYRLLVLESGALSQLDNSHYDLRVNTLNLASETCLNSLRVWQPMVDKRVSSFDRIEVWDSAGGRIQFLASEIGEHHLGHVVESSVLTTSLLEAIENHENVTTKTGVQLQSVLQQPDRVCLYLASGERITCRLVVGADGGESTVRESGEFSVSQRSYNQKALVAQIEASDSITQTALQAFLPTGPLAFLPLADGTFSIVWSCEQSFAENLLNLSQSEFEQQLSVAIDHRLGDVRVMSQIVSFELRKLEAEPYFLGRTVLVGDAAHIIHPLAGMGVNLGLMDAAALSEVLTEGKFDPECDPAQHLRLRKYERWRKSVNVPTGFIMDGFDFGFRTPSKLVQGILGVGLTATNRIAFAKQEIIRLACGLSGDLPSIARRQQ